MIMLFCASAGFADTIAEIDDSKGNFWLCFSGESAFYDLSGVSYGGAFALGYGKGSSIGIKTAWYLNSVGVGLLEINCHLRFYFFGKRANYGPFLQFLGGPAILFGGGDGFSLPSEIGAFSIGMGVGWRFLIKDRWFIEPSIRGGYPYLAGAGLAVGVCF